MSTMSQQEEDPFSIFTAPVSKRPPPAALEDHNPSKKHDLDSEEEGEDGSKRMEAVEIKVEREEEGCLH